MPQTYSGKTEVIINTSPTKVWEALTTPEIIKQYLFGTDAKSDWKVGSPIIYSGVWEGKAYEDKGQILEIEPEKILKTTYWSGMSGKPDAPENYQIVTYELEAVDGGTKVTLTQENTQSQESIDHSMGNWKMVLDGMKKLLES